MNVVVKRGYSFSALQRAEIAEILYARTPAVAASVGFSALQRAEIAEIPRVLSVGHRVSRFSALQRAEIAEMMTNTRTSL